MNIVRNLFTPYQTATEVELPKMEASFVKSKSTQSAIVKQSKMQMRADLQTLKNAIDDAETLGSWNRESLHRIFEEVVKDPNLRAQWETRKIKTLTRDFAIKNGDTINEEATKMFKKPWFKEFLSQAMDSKAWGFSVIEMANWDQERKTFDRFFDKDGNVYDPVSSFPRDYVKPEVGQIVETPGDVEGWDFLKGRLSKQLIFIGKVHDFGFLIDVAAMVLIKNRTIANWGAFAEVFGQDIIVAYSDAQGDARTKLETTLKSLGSGAKAIFDPDSDKLETVGQQRRDAHDVYKELMEYIDGQVAKRMFGQDVITNNTGRVVGTVGENVANLYGDEDAKWLTHIVNDVLIPFMKDLGIEIEGEFEWNVSEKLTLKEKADLDLIVTKMGFWPDGDYLARTYDIEGESVEPFFNRIQQDDGKDDGGKDVPRDKKQEESTGNGPKK